MRVFLSLVPPYYGDFGSLFTRFNSLFDCLGNCSMICLNSNLLRVWIGVASPQNLDYSGIFPSIREKAQLPERRGSSAW